MTLYLITSFSVIVAVLLSFFILQKADKRFLPFILLLYAGLVAEVINYYMANNSVSTNIYALFEVLLITWLFTNWNFFKDPKIGIWLSIIFFCIYIADILFMPRLNQYTPYFNVISSLAIIIMSVLTINKVILEENKSLVKNSIFLICIAFIIYFTNLALVEIFYIYGLTQQSVNFANKVYSIFQVINLITNLIYALAILWIPRKNYSLL